MPALAIALIIISSVIAGSMVLAWALMFLATGGFNSRRKLDSERSASALRRTRTMPNLQAGIESSRVLDVTYLLVLDLAPAPMAISSLPEPHRW